MEASTMEKSMKFEFSAGHVWFRYQYKFFVLRVKESGISIRGIKTHRLTFSERNNYVKYLRFWSIVVRWWRK